MSNLSRNQRLKIFKKDKFTCVYCDKRIDKDKLTVDHVFPRKLGGKRNKRNLVTACKSCNTKKGSKLLTDFIKENKIKITKRIDMFL